jgi:hypothetical protein
VQTPLHYAVGFEQASVALVLLQHGADIDATDVYGRSALFLSMAGVRAGADPPVRWCSHGGGGGKDIMNRGLMPSPETSLLRAAGAQLPPVIPLWTFVRSPVVRVLCSDGTQAHRHVEVPPSVMVLRPTCYNVLISSVRLPSSSISSNSTIAQNLQGMPLPARDSPAAAAATGGDGPGGDDLAALQYRMAALRRQLRVRATTARAG